MEKQTTVNTFMPLGLPTTPQLQILLFLVFLVIYLITLVRNMMIMLVIQNDPHLHTPMYFYEPPFILCCYLLFLNPCP